ncbi:unnamed protein product [Parascedosporium putredinis]|uniref:Uncharacterized protein n=1 Tax=Parascedosporium putredinis TaxID=1442378 RepID=A0A9P1H460_9PEZI|nr:unnamed protein product [Parascedosporium putredinis]CAI7996343.1 unnamed protein product [Parascedosporium putredinis]
MGTTAPTNPAVDKVDVSQECPPDPAEKVDNRTPALFCIPLPNSGIADDHGVVDREGSGIDTSKSKSLLSNTTLTLDDSPHSPLHATQVDYSSFTRPWLEPSGPDPQDWFTFDFYQAIGETSGDVLLDENFDIRSLDMDLHGVLLNVESQPPNPDISEDCEGRISRLPSPPNIASAEDYWAFAWNPSSSAISQTRPLSIDANHPIISGRNTRFDMGHAAWERLRRFLSSSADENDGFSLPPLDVTNAFVSLFFKHFLAQAP